MEEQSSEGQSSEGQSSEGERQSGDEQRAGDTEQKHAGPTGPGPTYLKTNWLRDSWGYNRCSEVANVSILPVGSAILYYGNIILLFWSPFPRHLLHIDIDIRYEKFGFKNATNQLGSRTLHEPTGGAYNLTWTESTFRKKA